MLSVTSSSLFQSYQAVAAYTGQLRSERPTPVAQPVTNVRQQQDDTLPAPTGDTVSLSPEAQRQAERNGSNNTVDNPQPAGSSQNQTLTEDELRAVEKLKLRDREVRTHEQAHLANAGQYAAGGPSYTYQQGPDGRRYAIGGEVPIDLGKEKTPEETIRKMQVVRRAAMAPASPSGADRSIAAAASQKEAQARVEMQQERLNPETEDTPGIEPESSPAENSSSPTDTDPNGSPENGLIQ